MPHKAPRPAPVKEGDRSTLTPLQKKEADAKASSCLNARSRSRYSYDRLLHKEECDRLLPQQGGYAPRADVWHPLFYHDRLWLTRRKRRKLQLLLEPGRNSLFPLHSCASAHQPNPARLPPWLRPRLLVAPARLAFSTSGYLHAPRNSCCLRTRHTIRRGTQF